MITKEQTASKPYVQYTMEKPDKDMQNKNKDDEKEEKKTRRWEQWEENGVGTEDKHELLDQAHIWELLGLVRSSVSGPARKWPQN